MSYAQYALIALAGFAAGAVNALAGGGTLICFPVLMATGLPALAANVACTIGLCPGYLGATLAQRADLLGQRRRMYLLLPFSMAGGLLGAAALLHTGEQKFTRAVPWLLLGACALLASQERLRVALATRANGGAVIAAGAQPVPLCAGVYPAMTYLEAANRAVRDETPTTIDAVDRHVVILGGGDTGADCLGTVHRQGARSVVQIEILDARRRSVRRISRGHDGADLQVVTRPRRRWGATFLDRDLQFHGDERVERIVVRDDATGETLVMAADLVLIAAGFVGPELSASASRRTFVTPRATLSVGPDWRVAALEGPAPVFACGDAVRGQSLIVWAIAEGRSAAAAVDARLTGRAARCRRR